MPPRKIYKMQDEERPRFPLTHPLRASTQILFYPPKIQAECKEPRSKSACDWRHPLGGRVGSSQFLVRWLLSTSLGFNFVCGMEMGLHVVDSVPFVYQGEAWARETGPAVIETRSGTRPMFRYCSLCIWWAGEPPLAANTPHQKKPNKLRITPS